MNNAGQIAALEGLLARVRRNAASPRSAVTAPHSHKLPDVDKEQSFADVLPGDESRSAPIATAVIQGSPSLEAAGAVAGNAMPVANDGFPSSAPPEPIDDLDIEDFDEEVVEISESPLPEATLEVDSVSFDDSEFDASRDVDVAAHDDDEPASIGEALGKVAADTAFRHDASAREAVVPGLDADDADLTGTEVAIPLQSRASAPNSVPSVPRTNRGPTVEQLGATVNLEGPRGPELELDDSVVEPAPVSRLEAAIPSRSFAGAYDENLAPPAQARQELDQMYHAEAGAGPQVMARTQLSHNVAVAQFVDERPPLQALSFVELVERSLSLTER